MVQIYKDEAVIFDLDDLLYKEFDFMRSAFWEIAKNVDPVEPKKLFRSMMVRYFSGNKVLSWIATEYKHQNGKFSLDFLLSTYRSHKPDISLNAETVQLLNRLKDNGNALGLITDGRSLTQRNKIDALGLGIWIKDIVISEELGFEKPSLEPYLYFMRKFSSQQYIYIADNYNKDFVAPNQLGWRTIALLDNGLNIHYSKNNLQDVNIPLETVNNFSLIGVSSFTPNYIGQRLLR